MYRLIGGGDWEKSNGLANHVLMNEMILSQQIVVLWEKHQSYGVHVNPKALDLGFYICTCNNHPKLSNPKTSIPKSKLTSNKEVKKLPLIVA